MIYNQKIDYDKINIHKKQEHLNGYTFVPIKYNNKDLVIQTPKLFIPFNISVFNGKRYLNLTFQNVKNDKLVKQLIDNLDILHSKIKSVLKKYSIRNFIRRNNNDNLEMRFKILNNTLFFNDKKEKIRTIENLTYGEFIIHLNGLWIINSIITYEWVILQAKVDMPLHLCEYAFIDEDSHKGKGKGKGIPPPPPPPPPLNDFSKLQKIGLSKEAIEHKMKMERVCIHKDDLKNITLKKTKIVKKVSKKDELLEELKKKLLLKKNNSNILCQE